MSWIKCEDRMPEFNQKVLAWNGHFVSQCTYKQNRLAKSERGRSPRFENHNGIWRGVSHWQPLPEPPTV